MRRVCRIGTSLVNRLVLAAVFALWTVPASAHPHVWITAKIAFLTDGSRLIGIHDVWQLDDMFSDFLIGEYDTDGDGRFSEDETARLQDEAFSLLSETDYLSDLEVDDQRIPLKVATDFSAEIDPESHIVTYAFTTPLPEPVPLAGSPIRLALYDDTFYVDIGVADKNAVAFAGTDACSATIAEDPTIDLLGGLFHPSAIRLTCASS